MALLSTIQLLRETVQEVVDSIPNNLPPHFLLKKEALNNLVLALAALELREENNHLPQIDVGELSNELANALTVQFLEDKTIDHVVLLTIAACKDIDFRQLETIEKNKILKNFPKNLKQIANNVKAEEEYKNKFYIGTRKLLLKKIKTLAKEQLKLAILTKQTEEEEKIPLKKSDLPHNPTTEKEIPHLLLQGILRVILWLEKEEITRNSEQEESLDSPVETAGKRLNENLYELHVALSKCLENWQNRTSKDPNIGELARRLLEVYRHATRLSALRNAETLSPTIGLLLKPPGGWSYRNILKKIKNIPSTDPLCDFSISLPNPEEKNESPKPFFIFRWVKSLIAFFWKLFKSKDKEQKFPVNPILSSADNLAEPKSLENPPKGPLESNVNTVTVAPNKPVQLPNHKNKQKNVILKKTVAFKKQRAPTAALPERGIFRKRDANTLSTKRSKELRNKYVRTALNPKKGPIN